VLCFQAWFEKWVQPFWCVSPTADIPRVFIGSETFLFYCSPIWTPHRAFFFLFTKCLKTLVKFWRQNGINIVLYLDDGLGIGSSLRDCSQNSVFVIQSLIDAFSDKWGQVYFYTSPTFRMAWHCMEFSRLLFKYSRLENSRYCWCFDVSFIKTTFYYSTPFSSSNR
jgi:hypothetical protein